MIADGVRFVAAQDVGSYRQVAQLVDQLGSGCLAPGSTLTWNEISTHRGDPVASPTSRTRALITLTGGEFTC